jgi:alpha-mannosidase
MRTAGDPDIYPNLGKFNISYSLFPHSGDWKNGIWAEGDNFNVPVYAAEPPSRALVQTHSSRPEEESFFKVDVPGVIVSGIKKSEDGKELIVRLAEIEGNPTTVNLTVPVNVVVARRLNILEFPLENSVNPVVTGKTIQIKIRANEIVTLGILPAK